MTSVPASRSSACCASSRLDSRSISVLKRNPSLDSFATYTLPRNLTGYGGGMRFVIVVELICGGVVVLVFGPRGFFFPPRTCVALVIPILLGLFFRGGALILFY